MPPADPANPARLKDQSAYILRIRQHPVRGKVLGKDKDRKPLDPPPVIQLFVRDPNDPAQNYLQSPYFLMVATLWHEKEDKPVENGHQALTGALASSLHRLKDMDSQGQSRDGGFFVFGDLSCKMEGKYRLKIILYETLQGQVMGLAEAITSTFEVYNTKNFPGMQESTFMSRSFGDQGVRLRIRKESRQLMKRPASSYSPGQTHANVPGYPPSGYGPSMANGYPGGYVKAEDGLEEQASKRQRSANTSPSTYIERGGPYGSMAGAAYANPAYADPTYTNMATSMGMTESGILAQNGSYPGRTAMGYDTMQPGYNYADSRQNLAMYGPRNTDTTSSAGYGNTSYTTAGYTGSPYNTGTSGTNMPTGYYTNGNMNQTYQRAAGP